LSSSAGPSEFGTAVVAASNPERLASFTSTQEWA
jgi:hypothetical protein